MYQKNNQGMLKHLDFMLLDLLCLHIAFLLAYYLRQGMRNPYEQEQYSSFILIATMAAVVIYVFFETFKDVLRRGYYKEFAATVRQVILVETIVVFYLAAVKLSEEVSRQILWTFGVFYFLLSYVTRLGWKQLMKQFGMLAKKKTLVIVTTADRVGYITDTIMEKNYSFRIVGIFAADQAADMESYKDIPLLRTQEELVEFVCREWVDEAFFDSSVPPRTSRTLSGQFTEMGVVVHRKLAKEKELIGQKQFVENIAGYTVLTSSINYATPGQLLLKRLMDIAGGLVGCLLTGLIFIFVAPIIKIQSPGPVFFKQERIGRNGKHFMMYKFRSMYMDAEKRKKELMAQNRVKDGMMFKLEHDPRIIGSKILPDGTYRKGIGNLIRDWSLDEFPQFFNVLKGDMSLVGTRPPTVDEWEKYELHHRARLATKPGITGMWQANGRSEITDFEEVVRLDTKYINEWNFGLDIKLICKTITSVFKKEGSM